MAVTKTMLSPLSLIRSQFTKLNHQQSKSKSWHIIKLKITLFKFLKQQFTKRLNQRHNKNNIVTETIRKDHYRPIIKHNRRYKLFVKKPFRTYQLASYLD